MVETLVKNFVAPILTHGEVSFEHFSFLRVVLEMKCPHCLTDFHDQERTNYIDRDQDGYWGNVFCRCAKCERLVIRLVSATHYYSSSETFETLLTSMLVRPKVAGRSPMPAEVPAQYAEDYNEACLVLADSPKASAALSRRCLQHLLREEAKVKHQDLAKEIQEVLDSNVLPRTSPKVLMQSETSATLPLTRSKVSPPAKSSLSNLERRNGR